MTGKSSRAVLAAFLLCGLPGAGAVERVSVCFNYGCLAQAEVAFSDRQLGELGQLLGRVHTPAEEREAIGEAVGRLLAGELSPNSAANCSHHEHGHNCGSRSCGDDRHGCSGNK